MTRFGAFRESDAKRIARATRIVEGAPGTFLRVPERIPRSVGSGGDCACITVIEVRCFGNPTGGTLIMNWPADDGGGDNTEDVTFDYNESSSGASTALQAHSDIASSDISVTGGPLPNSAIYVAYISSGTLNRNQSLPSTKTNSLTGGSSPHFAYAYITKVEWDA